MPRRLSNMSARLPTFTVRVCVWRYDTILLTTLTPREFHLNSFARLAKTRRSNGRGSYLVRSRSYRRPFVT